MRMFMTKVTGMLMLVAAMSSVAMATVDLIGVDIGTPVITGTTTCGTSDVTLTGGGLTLWSSSDDLHYGMQLITGDATITVRYYSYTNAQTYTKTGIMFRESLDGNSMNAFVGSRGSNNLTFQRRYTASGSTSETRQGTISGEPWIRLVRSGDNFSAYRSADGTTWTQIGSTETISMSDEVYVGLAMCGASTTETVTVVYDNISGLADLNVAPVADAGIDQTVTDSDGSGDESLSLDASGSSDSDGTIVSYVWEENSTQIATGQTPSVTLSEGTHTIDLTITDDGGATDTDSVVIIVEAAPIADLIGVDIGSPVLLGSTTSTVDDVTMLGGGNTLWGSFDDFHYGCQLITGDADVIVHYDSFTNAQTYTKTGIMFRESLDSNSMNAFVGSRGSNSLTFQRRTSTGGTTSETRQGTIAGEPWIRLVRSGDDFSAYRSADGSTWTQIGTTATIYMYNDIYIGISMCGASTSEYVTAVYDDISGFDTTGVSTNAAPVADAGSDITSYDSDDSGDELVTLDGTLSSDSDGTIASYVWSDSFGQLATGSSPQVYMPVGTTTVTLTVTDDDGATDTDTVDVTVDAYTNLAPSANAGSDQSVTDSDDSGDELVTLDASGSSDSDGTIASYVWEENSTQIATGISPDVTLAVGTHTITLTVTDDDGATDTDTVDITVEAAASLSLTGIDIGSPVLPGSTTCGTDTVTMVGGGMQLWSSSDSLHLGYMTVSGDADVIVHYDSYTNAQTYTKTGIMFRDTLDANSPNAFVGSRGSNNLTFQRRYTAGGGTSETKQGTIGGEPWIRLVRSGDSFSAYRSVDGSTWTQIGATETIVMTGDIYIGLAVSGASDTEYVTAVYGSISGLGSTAPPVNADPIADAGPDQTVTDSDSSGDEFVSLDGTYSSDSDGTITSYVWTENSTQIATGSSPDVTLAVGTHTIDLTVTDDDGGTDTDTVVITVDAGTTIAPTANAGVDLTIRDLDNGGDESLILSGFSSSDADGYIDSYSWSISGVEVATGATPTITLAVGTHTVDLTVTDDDGLTDTDSLTVTVVQASTVDLTGVDVGGPVLSGSTTTSVGSVTVAGGGNVLWSSSDDFHYACQSATGDLDVTVRLVSLANVQTYTKGGLMFRDSLDHNSMYAMIGHRGTGATLQYRSSAGASTSAVTPSGGDWYRLVRQGDVFSAYRSSDGVNWTQAGSDMTIDMADTIYIGLALCGNSETETVTAVYDNISGMTNTGISVNETPSAYAGEDFFTRDLTDSGDTVVSLDGSASADSDGSIVSYIWSEEDLVIATGQTPQVTLDCAVHDIQLTVIDDDGSVNVDYISVEVAPFGSPTSQTISEYKSGISLEVLGTYWDDYIVEQWYHDPKIDPRCTIYINSDVDINLFHNEKNMNTTGESTAGDEYIIIGADGLDGIPNSGDEGIIRYRVDQNMTQRAMWSQSTNLYPAWPGAMSFDDMEYPDSGNTAVVGATGAVPGGDITDRVNFYWRGMIDSVGDEWHVMAVGDDDDGLQSYYANTSSDGKIYYFVVNPATPACNIIKNDADAQFFTTAPKAYFVPVIRDQTTYLLGDCDIELSALGRASVEYSLVEEGQTASWQNYTGPINTVTAMLASDTRYELKYRIGSTGTVKTRIVHFDPSYPSDTEDHPKDIMWDNGSVGIQRIKDRLTLQPYADAWDDCFNSPFIHRRTSPYPSTLHTGDRWCMGQGILANAFPILMDGVNEYPDMEQHVYYSLLDSFLNLDPVGQEGTWSLNSPSREINMQGYYSVSNPLSIGIAYDWVIKDMRKANTPYGFTAVEDYKIRDMLAIFCNWTANLHAKTNQNVDENDYNCSMWSGSWTHGAGIISAIIDDYDTDLYGTSGAPTGTFNAPRAWTPFPDYPMTWWDIFYDKTAVVRGTPNLQMRSTFWGLLNEDEEWYDRGGYWHRMKGLYYLTMNFRVNYDNYRFPHLESAVKKIAEGGQILPQKYPYEGYIEDQTIKLVNHNFSVLAPTELLKLTTEDIDFEMWSGNATSICLYEYDWDQ